jgi:hypothetical protein
VFAGTNGEELKLAKKSDGKYSFGVSYAYDVDFGWMTQFSTDISTAAIGALPVKVKWNIYNKKTGKFITAWTETEKHSLKTGGVKFDNKKVIKDLLVNQADIELVFGVEKDGKIQPKYFLPIGEFCKKDLTDYFKNLTDSDKRCDQIKESDVSLASHRSLDPFDGYAVRPVKGSATLTH